MSPRVLVLSCSFLPVEQKHKNSPKHSSQVHEPPQLAPFEQSPDTLQWKLVSAAFILSTPSSRPYVRHTNLDRLTGKTRTSSLCLALSLQQQTSTASRQKIQKFICQSVALVCPNVVNKTLKIYNSSIRGTEAPLNYII